MFCNTLPPLACEQALRLEPVQRLPPQCLCNLNFQNDQKHLVLLYFCRCRCPAHSQNFSPGLQAYPWVSRPLFFYFQSRYVISCLRNVKVLHQEIARFTNSPASSVNCFDLPSPLLLLFFLFSTKTIICGKRSCGAGMCFWGWQKPYSIYWAVYQFTSLCLSETLTKFCKILFCATFCDCMPFGNIRRNRYPIKSY